MKRLSVFLLLNCGAFAQSLVVTGPLVDYAQNSHVRPMPFAATVAALPATGCSPNEMQYVISANSIYVNSTTGGCTWAALAGGSGGGGGLQDPGANGPIFRSSLNVTRPSVAADIVALFSGCVGSQYLGADGSCHVPGGGGLPDPGSNGIVKRTAPNTTAIAVAGVDYAPPTSGIVPLKGNGSGGFSPALGTDIVTLFTGCSGTQYLGADAACHTLPIGGQYITGTSGEAIYIPATTHNQGINANTSCYSGPVSAGATTGVQVICAVTKDNLGNLTVSWGGTTVGSIEVFSTGAGPQGPPGTGLADPGANGPVFRTSFDVTRPSVAADIVNMFAGCSGIQYLGADGNCHTGGGGGGGGATPYVTNASTSPQVIAAGTHGQGINPIVQCFSGAIASAATTGNYVICPYSKTSSGNVTVYYTSGEVGSIWVGSAGSGGGGGGGGGGGTIAVTNLPLKGDNSGNAIAAGYGDIASLWTSCSGTQYLGFDGNCHTAGTLNSVALSVPTWLSVSGTPVTGSSGTFTVTAATGQTPHQVIGTCGSATTFGPCPLVAGDISPAGTLSNNTTGTSSNVTGTVVAANGGTGEAGTLTGIPKANGTSAYTLAAFGDIVSLWSGCSGSQYLGFDGSCHNPSGGGTVSNVGLLLPGTVFSISGSPVSTSGTLTGSFINQSANTFFAGPCTGGATTPAFRGLCSTDIAALGTLTNNTSGNAATATALTATPTLCSTGEAPTGVLASGNATGCASYAPPTTGTTPLKGNGSGGFSPVVASDIGALGTLTNSTTGTANGINGVLTAGLPTGILKNTTSTGVPSIAAASDVGALGALTNNTSGNAGTATALAATPTLCTSGQAPTGVLANGNATGCAVIGVGVSSFNTRTGPVTLTATDVNGVGGITNNTTGNSATATQLTGNIGTKALINGSASLQTTVCALPAAGGEVIVNQDITLLGNITTAACGPPPAVVTVTKVSGVTITPAGFSVFNVTPRGTSEESYHSNTTSAGLPTYFTGLSVSQPQIQQNDSAMIFSRALTGNYTLGGPLPHTLGSFMSYNGSSTSGTVASIFSQLLVNGNVASFGGTGIYSNVELDSHTTTENIGLHGECIGSGTGTCVSINAEGSGAGATVGLVSNTGTGSAAMPITAASWGGGVASITVTSLEQQTTVGTPIIVSGMTPSGYNCVSVCTVASVTGSGPYVLTYSEATSLGVGTAFGQAELPSTYQGMQIFMHHSSTNTGGLGALISGETGTHPIGLEIVDHLNVSNGNVGYFTSPLQINKITASSSENIAFNQADTGIGALPSYINWYRAGTLLGGLSMKIGNSAYTTSVATINIKESGVSTEEFIVTPNGITSNHSVRITPTTVSGLGACVSGNEGTMWGVTDALAPSFLVTIVGGGTTHSPVYCNGTNWVAY